MRLRLRLPKLGKHKKEKAGTHAPELEQALSEETLQPAGNDAPPAPSTSQPPQPPAAQPPAFQPPPPPGTTSRKERRAVAKAERKAKHQSDKAAHQLCRELGKALSRPVIPVDERPRDQAVRKIAEHRRTIISLGVLGTGIATVCTAGTASAALAIVAACLPAADFRTFFDTEAHDPNRGVRLEPDAVSLLLLVADRDKRSVMVLAAVNAIPERGSGGLVTLSAADIKAAITPKPAPEPRILGIRIAPVRAGVRMGLTVITGGLLLLALTIIPEDIHGLMIKVASAILVVGALIVGAAVTNGSWLTGLGHAGDQAPPAQTPAAQTPAAQTPAALTGDGNHSPF